MKKLGDAELEIMKVLWSHNGPLTSNQILEGLAGIKDWKHYDRTREAGKKRVCVL